MEGADESTELRRHPELVLLEWLRTLSRKREAI